MEWLVGWGMNINGGMLKEKMMCVKGGVYGMKEIEEGSGLGCVVGGLLEYGDGGCLVYGLGGCWVIWC